MDCSFRPLVLALLPVLFGCASSAQARECPATGPTSRASSEPIVAPAATSAEASAQASEAPAPSAEAAPSHNATSSSSPARSESLPELKLDITGMHIGGGPNDPEAKRPFLATIEAGFPQMRECYLKSEDPAKGGIYGVDLRVERAGGSPTIQAVRTAMKGDAMRACLESSFKGLSFGKPARGTTVLSVSVRFALSE